MTNQTKEELKKEALKKFGGYEFTFNEPVKLSEDIADFWLNEFDNIINEKIVQIELKKIERQGAYNTADIKLGEMKGLDLAITILKE